MDAEKDKVGIDRRGFLRRAGMGVGAAGALAVTAAGEAQAASELAETGKTGYRETEHVRTYYELARR